MAEKILLDKQCVHFIIAANLPFRVVEQPQFKIFCSDMRPGYVLPNRMAEGDKLLDTVFEDVKN